MPAPRAVLTDIREGGLDPATHHRIVGDNGRLKANVSAEKEPEPSVPAPVEIEVLIEEKTVPVETVVKTEEPEATVAQSKKVSVKELPKRMPSEKKVLKKDDKDEGKVSSS